MSNQASIRSRGLNTPADFWGLVDLVTNLPAAQETLAGIRVGLTDLDASREAHRVEKEAAEKAIKEHGEKLTKLSNREAALAEREAAFAAIERTRTAELSQLQTDAQAEKNHYARLLAELGEREAALTTREAELGASLADRTAALDAREAELHAFAEKSEGLRRTLAALG